MINYSPVIHVVPRVIKKSIGHWLTAISLEILTHKLQMNSLDTAWLHVTTTSYRQPGQQHICLFFCCISPSF